MLKTKSWSVPWGGRTLTIETGRFALQTHGSCTVRYGDTLVLATVVQSENVRAGIDYFPLMVDFEEKLYAAGKIKGSRFIKREGRPSDEAILSGRLIDRAIRPLFDERVRNDVQVVVTPLSVDGQNDAAITALIAASTAIAISPVPWAGPIAAARVGRIKGELVLNVTLEQLDKDSDLDLVVAGTPERLIMTEVGAKEVTEADLLAAMRWGCGELQSVVGLIQKIQREVGAEKFALPSVANDLQGVVDTVEEQVRRATQKFIGDHAAKFIFDTKKMGRQERVAMVNALKEAVKSHLTEQGFEEAAMAAGLNNIKQYISVEVSKRILAKQERLDGRNLTEVRPLQVEVDLLPRVHGSAMFMRGDTQVLSAVTLAGAPLGMGPWPSGPWSRYCRQRKSFRTRFASSRKCLAPMAQAPWPQPAVPRCRLWPRVCRLRSRWPGWPWAWHRRLISMAILLVGKF